MIDDMHATRRLVAGESLAGKRAKLRFRRFCAIHQSDECDGHLAATHILHANNCGFGHRGMLFESRFNLARIDVFAADDD